MEDIDFNLNISGGGIVDVNGVVLVAYFGSESKEVPRKIVK
jgi:hypothetical protein